MISEYYELLRARFLADQRTARDLVLRPLNIKQRIAEGRERKASVRIVIPGGPPAHASDESERRAVEALGKAGIAE